MQVLIDAADFTQAFVTFSEGVNTFESLGTLHVDDGGINQGSISATQLSSTNVRYQFSDPVTAPAVWTILPSDGPTLLPSGLIAAEQTGDVTFT